MPCNLSLRQVVNSKNTLAFISCFVIFLKSSFAQDVFVAVAANFSVPMQKIAPLFEKESGHKVIMSIGSTGGFYSQIKNGAPFQILLSADTQTPKRLAQEGFAQKDTQFTYATGRLVLWSSRENYVDANAKILSTQSFQKIAIADPKLAPYGLASIETLKNLHLLSTLESKIVQGESIAQAYQFVFTQNADLGFVALSQVVQDGKISHGSAWIVPNNLHNPIQQDAILLRAGYSNEAAKSLLNFLKSSNAKSIIASFGYDI
jgi:molybdate transport system substrate-binding protein